MEKKKDGIKKYFHLHSYYSLLKTCDVGTTKNKNPHEFKFCSRPFPSLSASLCGL
jgi:hypothetical protein